MLKSRNQGRDIAFVHVLESVLIRAPCLPLSALQVQRISNRIGLQSVTSSLETVTQKKEKKE